MELEALCLLYLHAVDPDKPADVTVLNTATGDYFSEGTYWRHVVSGGKSEVGSRKSEVGSGKAEVGRGKAEMQRNTFLQPLHSSSAPYRVKKQRKLNHPSKSIPLIPLRLQLLFLPPNPGSWHIRPQKAVILLRSERNPHFLRRRVKILSPLLSNIVLDELDKELERRGHRFVRYAASGSNSAKER
ncbi:MAG: hypothetical protein H6573_36120 [Lewinellaceae bacterium]|nr:hypothetical protein [Lewinellaceae bacterium]